MIDQPTTSLGIERQLVPYDSAFRLPEKCPYCGADLYATAEQWEQRDDGTWKASYLDVECDTAEEALESEEFNSWLRQHSVMPYVYMLPIEQRMTTWINRRFNFDMDTRRPLGTPAIGYGGDPAQLKLI